MRRSVNILFGIGSAFFLSGCSITVATVDLTKQWGEQEPSVDEVRAEYDRAVDVYLECVLAEDEAVAACEKPEMPAILKRSQVPQPE